MALFRKKQKTPDEGDPAASGGSDANAFQPQPEKARKWFDHAKAAAMSTNYAYALKLYASGLKLDPETMSAHEVLFDAAVQYASAGGKPASGKETREIDDGTPVGRFAATEFAWMKDLHNGSLALKALEAAVKSGQHEWGNWAAPRVLAALRAAKKPNKGNLLQARDLFAEVNAWDQAITAGELALQLDPTDGQLANDLKALAAQRAMDQGGYEEAGGAEGGFRKFVKDIDRQRELEEEEALAGAATVDERNLLRARRAYEENPESPDAINKYAQLIKKQGTDEALEQAHEIYMKGYRSAGEYRFRMAAGDIRIQQARERVKALTERIRSNGESPERKAELQEARKARMDLEAAEYRERVGKYPTDRNIRFQLGVIEYELGNTDAAMTSFQKAKDEPKLRVRAGQMLGRCFARESWHSDAISEFREALGSSELTDEEREKQIRYDLMLSLIAHAREEKSADLAREAREECSTIARRDIAFRDIRDRRREIDELVKSLES